MRKLSTFLVLSLFLIICMPFGKATLKDGLVSYYSFNTASPTDSLGLNNGNATNTIFNSSDFKGGAGSFYFDGTAKVEIADSSSLTFSNFSYSLWFKDKACPFICSLYSNGLDFGVSENMGYVRPAINYLVQQYSIGGGEMSGHFGTLPSIYDGNWHYIVFTHNGTGQATYVDGVMQITSVFTGNIYNGNPRIIGNNWDGTYSFVGFIDEMGLYNRSLTQIEVEELYNGGSGLFYPFGSEPAYTTFSSQSVNNTNPNAFEDVLFSISVTNPYGINKSMFSYFNGSTWVNDTAQNQTNFECYQETANESTSCGGLATGSYVFDNNWKMGVPIDRSTRFVIDGSWSGDNGGQVNNALANASELYINYSVPAFASSTKWVAYTDSFYPNSSIPSNCFVSGNLYLMVQSNSTNANVYFYCKTNYLLPYYDLLINNSPIGYGSTIFEEAIIWIATTQTDVNLQTVKTIPDSWYYNYTWYAMNSTGDWIQSEIYYLNVTPISLFIVNYTPIANETTIFVSTNTTQKFNVTVSKQGWGSWFLDGILQFFQTIGNSFQSGWTWAISSPNTTLPHTVLVIINDSTGQSVSHEWMVNVSSYGANLYVSPNNVSAQYQIINISCQVPSDNATVIISYSLPSSTSWVNLSTIYNSETGYFDSSVITQLDLNWIGTLDFRCIGYDFVNNITIEQYSYDSVNVYLPAYVPPTLPTSVSLVNGLYDASISLQCLGGQSLSGYLLYYDFKATYIDTNGNLQTGQPIMENSSLSEFKWYLLNLPEQQDISVSCRAYDGITYSNWLNLANNITITHGLNLNMFHASIHKKYFVNSKIILAEYCNVADLQNTKIFGTWADCNEDGQWDYVNMYNSTEKNYTSVYDYFSCIYPNAGVYNVIIGCVTERKDPAMDWNKKLCPEIESSEELCDFQKAFTVTVDDITMPEVRK